MRIAIDARLNAYRQGGIPQYTRQLLTALADVARDDHQLISLQHRDHLRPLAVAPNVMRRTVLTPPHHRFEQWTLPLEVWLARPDVLHCPDFIAPLRRPCPAVVTIHDLAFLHYPEILDDAARAYYGQITRNAARADAIIAVSEATRQDIAQFLDIPIEEIAVIYEAAAPLYVRQELRDGEARVLGSTPVAADTFMLFVSTLEPRKNLPTLLHALRICLDRRPDRPYRLVVAGARGWRDEVIFATARDLRLADHVLFVGSVGQYDLRWLYNACRLYINPSLYEGFGLPLLEAMACGAACLAAATSSLPEIGGNAALYIPPLDVGLWADAIEALWDDRDRRAELGRLGRMQAQRFSWMRAARQTLKIYERVVERAHPRAGAARAQGQEHSRAPEFVDAPAPAEAADGAGRTCLRCGSSMLASRLQREILVAQPESTAEDRRLAALAWLCPRCGYVELVAEQVAALAESEHAAAPNASVAAEAPATDEPEFPLAEAPDAPATDELDLPLVEAPDESAAPEMPSEAADSAAAPTLRPDDAIDLPGDERLPAELTAEPAPIESKSAPDAPHVAATLVLERPAELARPDVDTPAASDDAIDLPGDERPPTELTAEPEPIDGKSVPDAPRVAITLVLERPAELARPDVDTPANDADEQDAAREPAEVQAGVAPDDLPNSSAHVPEWQTRNGNHATAIEIVPTAEQSVSSGASAQPKRQRQTRAKRKRSP